MIVRFKRWLDFKRRGIKVWPGAYVYPTAVIGNRVNIGRNAEIGDWVRIGNDVRIGHGAFIPAGVTIESHAFIGPGTIMTNDNYPPSPKEQWRKTIIRTHAAIGAGCIIKPGIIIGAWSTIGCGSVVTKNIPAGKVYAGNPAVELVKQQTSVLTGEVNQGG